jgi:hypothetical protein
MDRRPVLVAGGGIGGLTLGRPSQRWQRKLAAGDLAQRAEHPGTPHVAEVGRSLRTRVRSSVTSPRRLRRCASRLLFQPSDLSHGVASDDSRRTPRSPRGLTQGVGEHELGSVFNRSAMISLSVVAVGQKSTNSSYVFRPKRIVSTVLRNSSWSIRRFVHSLVTRFHTRSDASSEGKNVSILSSCRVTS